ncbi:MAG: hypothetical protein OEY93_10505 [Anaerolineae bacterium]|nr:hypothetical protein [Anaerolineae bacterium]
MTSKYSITHIRKVVKYKSGNECSLYGLGLYENSAEFYEYCQNKYEAKAEKVKNRIIHKNYKAINNLCENAPEVCVLLEGDLYMPDIINDLFLLKAGEGRYANRKYRGHKMNYIYNHMDWTRNNDWSEDYRYFLVKCNTAMLKYLFYTFWYPDDCETSMKIILLDSKYARIQLEKWARMKNGPNKDWSLIDRSLLVLWNYCKGFHYGIYTNKEEKVNTMGISIPEWIESLNGSLSR